MWSKTQNASDEKTKWALEHNIVRGISILFILGLVAFGGLFLYKLSQNYSNKHLVVGDRQYVLEVSDTHEKRIKGLSGRQNLPENKGMLFTYAEAGNECIWMKDMHFSLDILWLNADKKVIKIERSVSPKTYPRSFCANGTQYVIELNAGEAAKAGVKVGQQIEL